MCISLFIACFVMVCALHSKRIDLLDQDSAPIRFGNAQFEQTDSKKGVLEYKKGCLFNLCEKTVRTHGQKRLIFRELTTMT